VPETFFYFVKFGHPPFGGKIDPIAIYVPVDGDIGAITERQYYIKEPD
jgi:hypothetical protein